PVALDGRAARLVDDRAAAALPHQVALHQRPGAGADEVHPRQHRRPAGALQHRAVGDADVAAVGNVNSPPARLEHLTADHRRLAAAEQLDRPALHLRAAAGALDQQAAHDTAVAVAQRDAVHDWQLVVGVVVQRVGAEDDVPAAFDQDVALAAQGQAVAGQRHAAAVLQVDVDRLVADVVAGDGPHADAVDVGTASEADVGPAGADARL